MGRSSRLWPLLALALALVVSAPGPAALGTPPAAAAEPAPGSFEPGVVHVKFRRGVASAGRVAAYRARGTRQLAPGLGTVALPVAPGTELAVVRELLADPSVEYAEPSYRFQLAMAFPNDAAFYNHDRVDPNDPEGAIYVGLDNAQRQYMLRRPQVPEAWDLARGSPGMVIAVIDSGAYLTHPDLAGRLLPGANFVSGEEGNKNEQDNNGHGTAVTGVLIANQNNGQYLAGVNWRARVLPIKAFNDQGTTTVEPLVKAIKFAADNGARVVNMSLNYTEYPAVPQKVITLQDAITTYLVPRGVVVVAAMGNFGLTERSRDPLPPANFDSVIAVGASSYQLADGDGRPIPNPRELLSSISNRGPWMSVVAPGENVRVLWGLPTADCGQQDPITGRDLGFFCGATGDRYISGSSLATPLVGGVASLIMGCHPSMGPGQVRAIIEGSADKIGETEYVNGRNEFYGHGRVNALKALTLANTLGRVVAQTGAPAPGRARVYLPLGLRGSGADGLIC
jgi:subtilisin family serine protease